MPGGPRAYGYPAGDGTLPVIDLDGGRIIDSTAIIAALEAHHPEPPLYPSDPEERRRAWSSRTIFDEHAGHDMRRVGSGKLRENLDYGVDFMTTDQPRIRARGGEGARCELAFPVVWRYMKRRYDFTEKAVERSRGDPGRRRSTASSPSATAATIWSGEQLHGRRSDRRRPCSTRSVWPPEFPYDLPEPPRWEFLEPIRDHPALEWIRETWRRHSGTSAAASDHQPSEPGSPLKGPSISSVIQPP